MQSRYLNPWMVIADWTAAGDARFVGRDIYREYPRIVLARTTVDGEQRLFVDSKTGFPIKLDLLDKHYLWGERHIEYLYSNWTLKDGGMIPGLSFRISDCGTKISQSVGKVDLYHRDSV